MNAPDIHSLVPHSGAMSLLGRFVDADEESLRAEVNITQDTMFCVDGAVGAWVGVEYMAQAVAAHAGWCARRRGEPVRLLLTGTTAPIAPRHLNAIFASKADLRRYARELDRALGVPRPAGASSWPGAPAGMY